MRITALLAILVLLNCCDHSRVYEKNNDFAERQWLVNEKPSFEFTVDKGQPYNLYCNLRNSIAYPYSRIFITYTLKDSVGAEIKKEMINSFLFDEKTGKPNGSSGLGDIYDQQLILLKNYTFSQPGTYNVQFEQFMRTDTLQGVLAVGLRVEKVTP
ncbi:MAG TPA: gliding motility lipoprotein GldH [Cyclobacteriaceae bacterium]|nr:gliding motility lipoprotein GldH [Cyclobacteriaceae bacterium]